MYMVELRLLILILVGFIHQCLLSYVSKHVHRKPFADGGEIIKQRVDLILLIVFLGYIFVSNELKVDPNLNFLARVKIVI